MASASDSVSFSARLTAPSAVWVLPTALALGFATACGHAVDNRDNTQATTAAPGTSVPAATSAPAPTSAAPQMSSAPAVSSAPEVTSSAPPAPSSAPAASATAPASATASTDPSASAAPSDSAPATSSTVPAASASSTAAPPSGAFELSSPAWEGIVNNDECVDPDDQQGTGFAAECPTYPLENTGLPNGGMNISPELSWTPGPEGTLSYAVVLTDTSNGNVHWVLWDIPADVTMLPAGLPGDATLDDPEGAQQKALGNNATAYRGSGRCSNVYEHAVYPLTVAMLDVDAAADDTVAIKAAVLAAAVEDGGEPVYSFIRSQSRTSETGCD